MLSSQEVRALRAAAHSLRPVVLIGDQGLTEAVLREIDTALKAHELIKIRAGGQERETRADMMTQICERLDAHPVHHLGKILIVWRPSKDSQAAAADTPRKRGPYTPKKLAAEGIVLDEARRRRRRASIAKGEARGMQRGLGQRRGVGGARKAARRKSALSLRARVQRD